MRRLILKALTMVTIVWLFGVPLFGQPIWLGVDNKSFIAVEVFKPTFKDDLFNEFTFISSAIFVSGRFSISENIMFVGELPIAYAKRKDVKIVDPSTGQTLFEQSFDAETMIGSPYVGLELHKAGSNSFFEIVARLPVAQDNKGNASELGVAADFDRFEAFVPDLTTLTGNLNYQRKNVSNVVLRLRGGASVFFPKDSDTEVFLDYSGQIGFEGQQISLIGGITGIMIVTESDLDLGERTVHHLGATAAINLGTVSPGVHFRIPIDDQLDNIDYVLGLNLVIHRQ